MKLSEKMQNRIDVVKEKAEKALPYATGAMIGIAIMVFSYEGARQGARKGLEGINYEFHFKTKDDEHAIVDWPSK